MSWVPGLGLEGPWPLEVPRAVTSGGGAGGGHCWGEGAHDSVARGPRCLGRGRGRPPVGCLSGDVPRESGAPVSPGFLGTEAAPEGAGWREMQAAAGKAGRASRAAWSGSFLLTRPRVSSGRAAQGPSGAFPTESGVYGRLEGGWEGPEGSWETRLLSSLVAAGD